MVIDVVTAVTGMLCILYFIVRCVIVRPSRLRFSVFWLCSGTLLLIISYLDQCFPYTVFRVLCYLSVFVSVMMMAGFILLKLFTDVRRRKISSFHSGTMIILGVNYPCREFFVRAGTAYDFYRTHPDIRIICTGGQGADEPMPESAAFRAYLLDRGVPEDRIFIEETSTSTVLNLYNAGRMMESFEESIALVTSDYHILRSVILAKKAGFSDVYAVPAYYNTISWINSAARELILIPLSLLQKVDGRMQPNE